MDNWKEITITALIAQAIGGAWLYLRSIGDKVGKKEHEKAIAELKIDLEKTNAELKSFARQAAVDDMKADLRRLETKIETKLDSIQQQLMALIARRPE